VTKYVEREIKNHRILVHPHIIHFKEVFLTDKYLGIVMEYAAGGDMFEYVAQKEGLHENEARWFFQQLVMAIDYCHIMVRSGWTSLSRDLELRQNVASCLACFGHVACWPRPLAIAREISTDHWHSGQQRELLASNSNCASSAACLQHMCPSPVAGSGCHLLSCVLQGVVNRDIKLENALLDKSARPLVKLCDFGYSKHTQEHSQPKSKVGTPGA
jgi:serine/threonine protein kinase